MIPLSLLFNVKAIASFALKHWKELLVVGMLATIIYQNTFEKRYFLWANTIPFLELKIVELEKAVDIIEKANQTLTDTIVKRNDQIEEWKEKSIELEKKNAKLSGQLLILREMTNTEVDNILAGPTPESCEASIDYLRNGIPDLNYFNRGVPVE